MKKTASAIIATSLLTIGFSLYVSSAVSVSAEENLLQKMGVANSNIALLENTDRVAFRTTMYDAEENVYSAYSYGDQERIVYENQGDVNIQEQDGLYGFDNQNKCMFTTLFLDDAAEYEYYSLSSYEWNDSETLLECYEEDGYTYLLAEITGDEMVAICYEILEALGYDIDKEYRMLETFVIDTESYEIQSGSLAVSCDEEEYVLQEIERVTDPEEYVVPEEILNAFSSDDTRTVTCICDPDTEYESTVFTTVPKGVAVKVQTSWEHPDIYIDRSCTEYFEEKDDFQTDITVYSKKAAFSYIHDPRENPHAMKDIVENPDAVYGFSPDPQSERLGAFAEYDWTDADVVEAGRQERIAYHESIEEMTALLKQLREEGKSIEEIARVISEERNRIRLEINKDDPVELKKVKESNLETYGNENGPTPDFLYEKYGSWETVLQKAFGTNPGMDACVGLYDEYYDLYEELGVAK